MQLFESALAVFLGGLPEHYVHAPAGGRALVVEHNGDIYACDHFVYPQYLRGNISRDALSEIVDGEQQRAFGKSKAEYIASECRACQALALCGGDCLKRASDSLYGLRRTNQLFVPGLSEVLHAQRADAGQNCEGDTSWLSGP